MNYDFRSGRNPKQPPQVISLVIWDMILASVEGFSSATDNSKFFLLMSMDGQAGLDRIKYPISHPRQRCRNTMRVQLLSCLSSTCPREVESPWEYLFLNYFYLFPYLISGIRFTMLQSSVKWNLKRVCWSPPRREKRRIRLSSSIFCP